MKAGRFGICTMILCLLAAGLSRPAAAQDEGAYLIDQIAAIVGGTIVKDSDIESRYLELQLQGYTSNRDMRCEILESFLEQKLLINQAAIDSVTVSEGEVTRELEQRVRMLIDRYGSRENLEAAAGKSLVLLRNDWRETVRNNLLEYAMQREILKDIKVSPSEVRTFYNKLPKDQLPTSPETYTVQQITMNPPYREEAIAETRQKLLELRRRVVNGESFTSLAVLYFEEEAAVMTGGELGFMSKSNLDPDFWEAAMALREPGDVSRVVETKFGYHIIQLIAKRGDMMNCRHIIMKPKADAALVSDMLHSLDSLANFIRQDSTTFELAARTLSDDESTRANGGTMINPEDKSTRMELTSDYFTPEELSVLRTMQVGEISKAFQTTDATGNLVFKIMKIKGVTPSHVVNLDDNYETIQGMALEAKMQEKLEKWVDEKIVDTYIMIDPRYRDCEFSNSKWYK
ncbi:MAG: peptidylprolyl isomerase [Bacteroidales bacterium]|nr:peptidylprolyl isomerase [Bacteroidales bacterium]